MRSQISIVLQDTVLFAGTIAENISLGFPEATSQQIKAAAKLARAHEFIRHLPNGYDTVVGERGVTLSHGQRQRIAIARAVVRDAPILLLDEPATALDQRNLQLVQDGLTQLAKGRTTILVTHNLNEARLADRILLVERGQVTEQGSHDELIRRHGHYARMYRLQMGEETDSSSARRPASVS